MLINRLFFCLTDASFKSEPVSDFNEDSKDSFTRSRSCTPIKPSPLTIKSEHHEDDENDSNTEQKSERLTMKLKVPKFESDSPRKRLKDKFEKEKGHEIKHKKKCKIKDEEKKVDNEIEEKEQDIASEKEKDESSIDKTDEITDKSKTEIEKACDENDKIESKGDEVDGIGESGKDAEVLNVKEIVNGSGNETTSENDKEISKNDITAEVKHTDDNSKDTKIDSDTDKNDQITSEKKDGTTSEFTDIKTTDKLLNTETGKTSKFESEANEIHPSDSPDTDRTSIDAINVDKSSSQNENKINNDGCDNTILNGEKLSSNKLPEPESDPTTDKQDNGLSSKNDQSEEPDSSEGQVVSSDKQTESPATESISSTNENGLSLKPKTDAESDVVSQKEETDVENKSENSQTDNRDKKNNAVVVTNSESNEKSGEVDEGAGTVVEKISDEKGTKASDASVSEESESNESQLKTSETPVADPYEKTENQNADSISANEVNTEDLDSADVKNENIEKPDDKVTETMNSDKEQSSEKIKDVHSGEVDKAKKELVKDKTDGDKSEKDPKRTKEAEQPLKDSVSKKAADSFSKERGNFLGAFEKFLNPNADTKDLKSDQAKDKLSGSKVNDKGAGDIIASEKNEENNETASSKRQTKVAVRKLTKKTPEKTSEEQENEVDKEKSDQESSSDSSDEDSSTSVTSDDVPLTKMKGLLAHSRLNRGKALKRQVCCFLNLFLPYANNKGADQPAHPHILIRTFVICCLDSIIPLVPISKISCL